MTIDWFQSGQNQQENEHPRAKEASQPQIKKEKRALTDEGSLDLGSFELVLLEDRHERQPLVKAPLKANGLSNERRISLRVSADLERYITAHTRGSLNAALAGLIVFALQELERTGQQLEMKESWKRKE